MSGTKPRAKVRKPGDFKPHYACHRPWMVWEDTDVPPHVRPGDGVLSSSDQCRTLALWLHSAADYLDAKGKSGG